METVTIKKETYDSLVKDSQEYQMLLSQNKGMIMIMYQNASYGSPYLSPFNDVMRKYTDEQDTKSMGIALRQGRRIITLINKLTSIPIWVRRIFKAV